MTSTSSDQFNSFKEIDWERQEKEDDDAMQALISEQNNKGDSALLDPNRPLDQGEKAVDAEDYEDISDDDLPEEEEASLPNIRDVPGLTDDAGTSHDTDDLFGERGSSPYGDDDLADLFGQAEPEAEPEPEINLRELNFPEWHGANNQDPNIPAPPESDKEFVKQLFPAYEENSILNWSELLPLKSATYPLKAPLKPPKPLAPTKVSLDLAPDQEKAFRAPGPAQSDKQKRVLDLEARGYVAIVEESEHEMSDDDDFDWTPPNPDEKIGGISYADIKLLVEDWDSKINPELPDPELEDATQEPMDEWEREILGAPAKRRKITHQDTDFINRPQYTVPSFDNFEADTARLAKRVVLDLNDPYLLVDIQEVDPRQQQAGRGLKRGREGGFASKFKARFNYSNDEAYDALKENHQHKVRATLGSLAVEHSMPALKLQWPYYRTKLDIQTARAYHRVPLKFSKWIGKTVEFSKLGMRKKKAVKGKPTQEIFAETKDLTLADHYSTATLLEYCEEHPTVLSNFGMGNRIINYYRRKDADDMERPTFEDKVGDLNILLPEDKSPFSNFGMVDPGETVRTIHNEMYRAPIYKHDVKSTDFLVVRDTTGIGGTSWHLRNIDNLFVVGQQFPSMEIPGPHSRRVTNAAKNRMKMIAYRKIRHSPDQHLKIGEVTHHIADSTDMQNRQKLKEFIAYDKTEKVWRMKPGEQVPEEATIRAMIKPEDVCIIDAMHVGSQQLRDAGYDVDKYDENDADDEGKGLEEQLTPWMTTKAFLDASAGKAMLMLHGAGDPTGPAGEGFSYIKISMKGGFVGAVQGPNATSEAAMEAERKANGGHTYNVKKQETIYNEAIRHIWDAQKASLSNPTEKAENQMEREEAEENERLAIGAKSQPIATPAGFDDSASQFSTDSRSGGKAMRITRTIIDRWGQEEEVTEIIKDPRVWREYQKRRHAIDAETMNVYEAKPTGNAEYDRQEALRVKKELARLERNKERRHAREKAKGKHTPAPDGDNAGSPSATPAPSVERPVGTTRKCANCGQMGHIKTNKKLCPMLNGTMKPEDSAPTQGGFGAITAPAFGS